MWVTVTVCSVLRVLPSGFMCGFSPCMRAVRGEEGVLLWCLFLDEETEAQSFAQSHTGGASISAKVSSALKMEFFPLDNTAFQMKAEIDKISP